MAKIIDGKDLAKKFREEVAAEAKTLTVKPHLAVILVGDDPASHTYVGMKEKACKAANVESTVHRLPAEATQDELMMLIDGLNSDRGVNGILVQMPLPSHLDQMAIFGAVKREKDVDGFHPTNIGLMNLGFAEALIPCTPAGIMEMLKSIDYPLKGKHVVVVGRSNVVGKPLSTLALLADATVTTCHRHTENLAHFTRQADVLIVAVGKVNLITADMVKPGAVVIDVGTNRVGDKLVGDVDYDAVATLASFITPVPGGVGPMTIALLLKNTVLAAKIQNG
ncbi:MAG: 5 10-methylene-tetrahydrofolate dehydrogenase/methenyl tetrahydrofolate cyclohydrolase [Bacillota bacterium]|nr:MAG: 5 10-methylene-tetrahydrofolate dehydrogenase/methenyl tetrahydrofolate cyclohydrolase [Bacillota bacterium]MBS3951319.1 bifunctional 5,10-methylenetetrahydrofolate dehydrogenase/5,10-methenyltetrahydrofolate cyclohydrolase [Peptococcaceae bacterium]